MSTHKPATRSEFKEFCLRQLGKPVIDINVDDTQVEDAVEIALSYFIDYHYDGALPTYVKHQLTQTDIDNGYITLPEEIIGVKKVFELGSTSASSNMFSYDYQFVQSMVADLTMTQSLIPYFTTRMQYEQIREMLVGQFPIRYNRHFDQLHLDVNKSKLAVDNYILIDAWTSINPDTETDIWSDRMLQKHATSLIKKVWGQSMSKFEGVQLPGGTTLNGRLIYDDAVTELQQIEDEYRDNYSIPPEDIIM